MSAVIAASGPISDKFIDALSAAIPEYSFERDENGSLVVAPNHTDGGAKSGEAYYQLRRWQESSGCGGRAFDASAGFRLPTSALRSPDASWISDERMRAVPAEQKVGYWNVCPDVAIEVASESDLWKSVCEKVDRYIDAGARYAVAIDPQTHDVYERDTSPPGLRLNFASIVDA